MNSRGQIEVIDFFVALAMFLVILIVLIVEWGMLSSDLSNNIEYNTMITKANQVADFLVTSEGVPMSWNSALVTVPGLALTDRNLSSAKISSFLSLPSSTIKDRFKIGYYGYNFSLVYAANSTLIGSSGESLSTKNTTVSVRRYATYHNATVYIDFQLGK